MEIHLYEALRKPSPPFSYANLREDLEVSLEDLFLDSSFKKLFPNFLLQRETERFLGRAEEYFSMIPRANNKREELRETINQQNYLACLESEEIIANQGGLFRHSYDILARRFKKQGIALPSTSFVREFDAKAFLNDIPFRVYMDRLSASNSSVLDTQQHSRPQNTVRNTRTVQSATYTKDLGA